MRINSKELLVVSNEYFEKEIFDIIEKDLDRTYEEIKKEDSLSMMTVIDEVYRVLIIETGNEPNIETMRELISNWGISSKYAKRELATQTAFRRTMCRKIKEKLTKGGK